MLGMIRTQDSPEEYFSKCLNFFRGKLLFTLAANAQQIICSFYLSLCEYNISMIKPTLKWTLPKKKSLTSAGIQTYDLFAKTFFPYRN